MEVLKGRFAFSIYENDQNGYCIYKYKNTKGGTFCAIGYSLPSDEGTIAVLYGDWEKNVKRNSLSFKVVNYEIEMPSEEEGTIQFLRSLHAGIGPVLAKRLWNKFGESLWDKLESAPESFLEVRGFTQKKLDALKSKISEKTSIQKIFNATKAYIGSITMAKITPIAEDLGPDAASIIAANPYILCQYHGIPFDGIDKMGLASGLTANHPNRLTAAILYQLRRVSTQGHMCYPKDMLKTHVLQMLNKSCPSDKMVTDEQYEWAISNLKKDDKSGIATSSYMVYLQSRLEQEKGIATNILRLRDAQSDIDEDAVKGIDTMITSYSKEVGVEYADAQLAAIRMAVTNNISVITGGPGTGKTTVIKAVIGLHKMLHKDSSPLLLAPTGKAARRMREQTSCEASTIHSALKLTSGDEEKNDDGRYDHVDANLVIVDEVSMLDSYVAYHLFRCIKDGSTVVLVGDSDQLPSVGAGNVLFEIIRSQEVPVTKLSVIFRQANTNPIVPNAAKIREGNTDLIEDGHFFRFYEEDGAQNIAWRACSLYKKAVASRGLDNVILLNPYRDKGNVSAKFLNKNLQHFLNPAREEDKVFVSHGIEFHKGDKIMQMRNTATAKNGDIGYIRDICMCATTQDSTDMELCCQIDFGGQIFHYSKKEMKDVDLAYCSTVHKAQGSEQRIVIFIATHEHSNLLRRNLIYTAVTRASDTVVIVGERDAFNAGIINNTQQKRFTLLGDYLHLYGEKKKKAEAILINGQD